MSEAKSRPHDHASGLGPYLSPLGAWAFALGTAVGWGSLVITANTYLVQAGPMGSVLGLLVGFAIMLIVSRNYHYMLKDRPDCGGVYAFTRDTFGYDHGVLTAWFLSLTYIAMFWANVTSLPLFARSFMGTMFQFGFHYQLFGYDIYLGEALLSVVAMVLAGLFCSSHKRSAQAVMIAAAVVFVAGITACFGGAVSGGALTKLAAGPMFTSQGAPAMQVLRIACMSPWAFIGFESITHLSEEFSFSSKRTFAILAFALVTSTVLYVLVTLLSVTAQPAGYADWFAYISDIDNLTGIQRLPGFFAAQHYLGQVGLFMLMAALLALIVSSLIGNITALSRLLYALARDEVLPIGVAELNDRGIPTRAIRLIILASLVTPFLGRTAIGWIVDVTTLGATIVYGFVSASAYQRAKEKGDSPQRMMGAVGVGLMVLFGVLLLLPNLLSSSSMATESYFLFTVWAVLGFLFFRRLLRFDDQRRFGKSVVAWIVLLSLILFTSLAWFGQIANDATRTMVAEVQGYYGEAHQPSNSSVAEDEFMEQAVGRLNTSITRGVGLVGGLFMFSLAIMLSNFATMRKREDESERMLAGAQTAANRDPLTGVKSKHAYVNKEEELNALIDSGAADDLAIVVCDVNGLKQVNDTLGHKAGDAYILAASRIVCSLFKHSPVYRIGGDEFLVVLQGSDFEKRHELMAQLDQQMLEHIRDGKVVVSAGMSDYVRGQDTRVGQVFDRADAIMYERKKELKGLQGLPER